MTITTEYNIGDTHWSIEDNRARARRIVRIDITAHDCGDAPPNVAIKYTLDDLESVQEENFIPTKEQLLQSL